MKITTVFTNLLNKQEKHGQVIYRSVETELNAFFSITKYLPSTIFYPESAKRYFLKEVSSTVSLPLLRVLVIRNNKSSISISY